MKSSRNNKIGILSLICLIIVLGILVIRDTSEPVKETGFYLDTICTIEIDNMDKKEGEATIKETFEKCKELENLLSKSIKSSDIYKINHSNGKPTVVSKDTVKVLKYAMEVSKKTNGLFDFTMGRLTDLWNFTGKNPKVPSKKDIDNALKNIGYKHVSISDNKVIVANPNIQIDLGGIAKGYIARELAVFLKNKGVTSGIVNLGGDLIAIGSVEKTGYPWSIGIEKPFSHREKIVGKVYIENQTLLTSGTYERCFKENGKMYHHILNPKTGYPVDTDILSFTIKSNIENAVYCDGYATACILLGSKKAEKFINSKKNYQFAMIKNNNQIIQSKDFNMSLINK